MMKGMLTLALLFAGLVIADAQRQETLFGGGGFRFSGIWGAFTNTYSFFDDDRGYHAGGNIGLEFGRSIYLGYAWNKLQDDIQLPLGNTSFRLRQNNFILSIMPNSYALVHPVISFQTGGGRVNLSDGQSDRVFIFQPSAGMEINIFTWFHLGIEGGYRFITNSDLPGVSQQDLSSPFAQLNLRFGVSWGGGGRYCR